MDVVVTPNLFAYIALILWYPIAIVLFRRYRPTIAVTLTAVGGVLLLPELVTLFDLPALPAFDKNVVVTTSILLGCLLSPSRRIIFSMKKRMMFVVMAVIVVSAMGTALTNGDTLAYGAVTIQGMSINDGISLSIRDFIFVVIPFFFTRAFVRSSRDVKDVYMVVVGAALIYSLLAIVEMWMSPQMHNWVYGFIQHSFIQTRRSGGGWRPMVFMGHGLALAVFFVGALLFAASLSKLKVKVFNVGSRLWTGYLAVVLVMCKSMGALIYGVVCLPVVLLFKGRASVWVAVILCAIAISFPWSRAAGVFPTEQIVAQLASINQERAASLAFRFDNEDDLLEKAQERFLFGWGIYGRPWIYTEYGRTESITDGWWIIQYGTRGIFGFLFYFTLLIYPVVLVFRRWKRIEKEPEKIMIGTLSLVVALRVVELLPNGLFSFLPFFFSGALAGIANALSSKHAEPPKRAAVEPKPIHNVVEGGVRRPKHRQRSPLE